MTFDDIFELLIVTIACVSIIIYFIYMKISFKRNISYSKFISNGFFIFYISNIVILVLTLAMIMKGK